MASRTLFVADIPAGLSEADFSARFSSGFDERFVAARLRRDRNDNVVGFVDYVDHAAADEARQRWEGSKFSPGDERGLTIHFSHSSSRPRRKDRDAKDDAPQGGAPAGGTQGGKAKDKDEKGKDGKEPMLMAYEPAPAGEEGSGDDAAPAPAGGPGMPIVSTFGEELGPSSLYGGGMMLASGGYGASSSFSPSLFMQQPFQPAGNSHQQMAMAMPHPHMAKESGLAMPQVHSSPLSRQHMPYPSLPSDASSTLYIEGLPLDATEREVSHIFRHYAGYLSVRILPKESKHPGRSYNLCFVEFENRIQSTYAMHALQGYKMTPMDPNGLHISYAKSERRVRRR